MQQDELLTQKQVCQWLQISRTSLARLRKSGFPTQYVGNSIRFSQSIVTEWLEKNNKIKQTTTEEVNQYEPYI